MSLEKLQEKLNQLSTNSPEDQELIKLIMEVANAVPDYSKSLNLLVQQPQYSQAYNKLIIFLQRQGCLRLDIAQAQNCSRDEKKTQLEAREKRSKTIGKFATYLYKNFIDNLLTILNSLEQKETLLKTIKAAIEEKLTDFYSEAQRTYKSAQRRQTIQSQQTIEGESIKFKHSQLWVNDQLLENLTIENLKIKIERGKVLLDRELFILPNEHQEKDYYGSNQVFILMGNNGIGIEINTINIKSVSYEQIELRQARIVVPGIKVSLLTQFQTNKEGDEYDITDTMASNLSNWRVENVEIRTSSNKLIETIKSPEFTIPGRNGEALKHIAIEHFLKGKEVIDILEENSWGENIRRDWNRFGKLDIAVLALTRGAISNQLLDFIKTGEPYIDGKTLRDLYRKKRKDPKHPHVDPTPNSWKELHCQLLALDLLPIYQQFNLDNDHTYERFKTKLDQKLCTKIKERLLEKQIISSKNNTLTKTEETELKNFLAFWEQICLKELVIVANYRTNINHLIYQ